MLTEHGEHGGGSDSGTDSDSPVRQRSFSSSLKNSRRHSNTTSKSYNDHKKEPFTAEEEDAGGDSGGSESERVSPFQVFRYADRLDVCLMVFGAICAIAGGTGFPSFAFALGRMISDLLTADPEESAAKSALIMVYIGIGITFACISHVCCWCVAAVRQMSRVRALYFAAVLRQEIGWHDLHKPGELTARMTGDTRVMQNGINDRFSLGVLNLSMGVSGFVFGFVSCWEITLVMFGVLPFIVVATSLMGNALAKATTATRREFAAAGSIATEVMENIRTVQVFGKEKAEVERFHVAVQKTERHGMKRELMNSLSVGTTLAIINVAYCVVFFFSGYMLKWGRTTIGDVVTSFLSVLYGSMGMGLFFPSLTAFTESLCAAYHLFEAIQRVPPIDVDQGGVPVTGLFDSISFEHVRFSYPTRPDQVLFTDFNLTLTKGQKVAFSGSSGSGKSSVIGLLQRFYDPLAGAVMVDGVDMRELDLLQWRDQIGIVSQEPSLFHGTMMENVRMGKQNATEEEVIAACKRANIHDTIMSLPQRYDTPVGAVGSQLSGGQKQRLAIARALVKEPAILLLDEATSALDRKSEMEVQASLDELMAHSSMTIVVIAHRLATIRNVDRIYYISSDGAEGSRIAEQGTFDELMAMKGLFAAMVKAQGSAAVGSKDAEASTNGGTQGSAPRQEDPLDDVAAGIFAGSQVITDAQIAKLDEMSPRTERQRIPMEALASWEVSQTHVSLLRLLTLNRGKLWAVGLGLLGSLVSGAIAPVNTILLGKMLMSLALYEVFNDVDKMQSEINTYAPIFFAIAFAAFSGWLLQFFYGYAGELLTTRLRTTLFRQILRQDMSFFDIPGRDAGTLSGMLSGDCESIHQLCGQAVGIRIQTTCTVALGIIIGLCYQWKVALVGMACVPLVVAAMLLEQSMMSGLNGQKEGDSDDTMVTEALSNVRTVTSFNLKDNRTALFEGYLAEERSARVRRSIFVGIIYGLSQFVYYGSFALCYWYGGRLIKQGEADFEEVNVASLAVLMGAMSAGEAGGFAAKVSDARKATQRVFSVIDRVPDVDVLDECRKEVVEAEGNSSDDARPHSCEVALRNTLFLYPARPNQVVLASVTLDFPAGTTSGLMGQTGCGKSTILQLLACFYPHRHGHIIVNNHEIQNLDIRKWRRNISVILQEPDLFSGTVRENICYSLHVARARDGNAETDRLEGRGEHEEDGAFDAPATEEEIVQAAKWAHIHDDIMAMPEGYDTHVGYKGRALSGGQKQRVAIARGLLRRQTRLLLLDEATSALDNSTEAHVQQGIEAYLRHRKDHDGIHVTVISVAHRLTTIRHSDQIVVLHGGRIVEQGSHNELMALGGEYKTRWELYTAGLGQ